MTVYYNEIDPFCCAWLRELIKLKLIPDGEIDNRSIADVQPDDLKGFTQCHFFTGIGGWAYALRLANWGLDKPVWSGSCPCQPWSVAGKRRGAKDERDLWHEFYRLIRARRPAIVFGEQVASSDVIGKVGRRSVKKAGGEIKETDRPAWLDTVRSDLERSYYAAGSVCSPAAGYGAPHIRERLYWVAIDALGNAASGGQGEKAASWQEIQATGKRSWFDRLGNSESEQLDRVNGDNTKKGSSHWRASREESSGDSELGVLGDGDGDGDGLQRRREGDEFQDSAAVRYDTTSVARLEMSLPTNGFWANPDWLWCADKKWRPIESGVIPLVDGFSERVGSRGDPRAIARRLKGYGNAIVIPQAVEFIKAVTEILNDSRR